MFKTSSSIRVDNCLTDVPPRTSGDKVIVVVIVLLVNFIVLIDVVKHLLSLPMGQVGVIKGL